MSSFAPQRPSAHGFAAQTARERVKAGALLSGPLHMNDMQTFRLRYAPLARRARESWPKVKDNPKLTTVLASASFYLEMAETAMVNLATDDLSVQGWVDQPLRQVESMLDGIDAGKDYFRDRTGVLIKAYVSALDDSLQPYVLQVPEGRPSGKLPLVLVLHGWGGQRSIVNWGNPRSFEPWAENYLRLQIYGRGWTRYKGAGTNDVFTSLQQVRDDYDVDENRIYVTGGSMGGAGTWFLATHFPDVFAAAAPLCGYTDYRLDCGSTNAKADWEHRLYRAHDAYTSAANLKRLPVYFVHGDQDIPGPFGGGVDVGHSRVMSSRLKELGIEHRYDELPGVKHGIPGEHYRKSEQWLLSHRREPDPRQVSFQTSSLRFHRCSWLEVEGLREHFRESRIDASRDGDVIVVKTDGITRFAVRRKLERIEIDGQPIPVPAGVASTSHFALSGDRWTLVDRMPAGLRKRHGLQGPWVDAFVEPALYVAPSSNPQYAELAAFDLETYQRAHGGLDCSNVRGKAEIAISIRKDREVVPADITQRNLILFGDPESNTVLGRIHNRLPIRWSPSGIVAGGRMFKGDLIGCKFIYPNPLNPEKYVAVAMGTRPEALHALRIFHWQIPDYLVFDERAALAANIPYHDATPEHSKVAATAYLAAGFFDEEWRLSG